jgi:hypothetical protein
MPMVVEHIDKIARDLQRDVLYIEFDRNVFESYDYDEYTERNNLMDWLDEHDIGYRCCGAIARENGWESYRGQLYIDLPFDETDEKYRLLDGHLCNEDNTPRINGVIFYYLPLEIAMQNAHHDEPGFWETWADNF